MKRRDEPTSKDVEETFQAFTTQTLPQWKQDILTNVEIINITNIKKYLDEAKSIKIISDDSATTICNTLGRAIVIINGIIKLAEYK